MIISLIPITNMFPKNWYYKEKFDDDDGDEIAHPGCGQLTDV